MTHHRERSAAERGWRMFLDQEGVALDAPRGRRRRHRPPVPHAVAAGLATAALAAPLAVAQGGGDPVAETAARGDAVRQEVRNGTTGSETEIIGKFNATTGDKGGYVTRQSNTQTGPKAGGGAIYGCRGASGGTAAGSAPCLRASNLANGFAFEFASAAGPAGVIDVATPTDAPFVTDGGGLVANFNADKVDGKDAGDFLPTGGKAADADKLDGLNADQLNVDKVDGQDASAFVTTQSVRNFRVALSFGQTEEFVSNGPVGLQAQCRENISGDQDEARILAVTREDGAFMQGDTPHSGPGVNSTFLNDDTPEASRIMGGIVSAGATPNEPAADDDIDTGFVLGPNGQYIGMDETVTYALRVGGSNCLFIGTAVVIG